MIIDISEWYQIGVMNKWITPPICVTHDDPLTDEELEDILLEGNDPCIPVLRLLKDIPWFDDDNTEA